MGLTQMTNISGSAFGYLRLEDSPRSPHERSDIQNSCIRISLRLCGLLADC
jgi:hypothetical protein